jgi:hypothetical protein
MIHDLALVVMQNLHNYLNFGDEFSLFHSASSASAFGYQIGAPALIPGPSPAMREKGASLY